LRDQSAAAAAVVLNAELELELAQTF